MAAGGLSLVLLLAIPLLLLAIGAIMLLIALRPRRTGDAPHCSACGYNLTANESQRCPECGADLDAPRAIVRGTTQRRRAHIAFALVMMTIGLIPFGMLGWRWARTFNWYSLAPESWVLSDLASTEPANQVAALGELARRRQAGALSQESLLAFAKFCLTLQAQPKLRADLGQSAINVLGDLYSAQRLPQPEADEFLAQLGRITVATRPRQLQRKGVAYRIELEGRFPAPPPGGAPVLTERVTFGNTRVAVDGAAVEVIIQFPAIVRSGARFTGQMSTRDVSVGRHVLTVETDMSVIRGDDFRPLLTRHRRFELPLEVFESEPPGYLVPVDPPDWAGLLRSALRPVRLKFIPPLDVRQTPMIEGSLGTSADLPRSFVYDVILLDPATGRETELLAMRMDPDPERVFAGRNFAAPYQGGPLPPSATLILRGSRDGTEGTTDLTEYWNGEVRFDNVKIEQAELQQPSTNSAPAASVGETP